MPKGKICFFVPYYPLIKGGAEYQSKIIAAALQTAGFEVVYLSYGHDSDGCAHDEGFKIYQLKVVPTRWDKLFLYKGFMQKVSAILKNERPDAIYQRILNTFTYRLSSFSKKSGIPLVLHIADNYSVEFDHKKGFLKQMVFKQILKTTPTIICQTQYQKDRISKFGHSVAAIIPNMHPILTDTKPDKNRTTIVWIGNARPVKQLEKYLELAALFTESDYDFHIIGKVPDSSYGRSLLSTISTAKNITYHGSRDNEFVNSFLMQAGLLVNTSVSEGFSNTFIQAWMCATPVLALNSDPDGIMQQNYIGINCKGDLTAMRTALDDLLKDQASHARMQSNALQTARTLFSTEENITKFVAVIKPLLQKHDTSEN